MLIKKYENAISKIAAMLSWPQCIKLIKFHEISRHFYLISNPTTHLSHISDLSHYGDVIISAMESQITSVSVVCPTVCSGVDQRKHQIPSSLAIVRGIHRSPVDSLHKGPVTRKMFPFDDVIISTEKCIVGFVRLPYAISRRLMVKPTILHFFYQICVSNFPGYTQTFNPMALRKKLKHNFQTHINVKCQLKNSISAEYTRKGIFLIILMTTRE